MIKIYIFLISTLIFCGIVQCTSEDDNAAKREITSIKKDVLVLANRTDSNKASPIKKHKYSSKIPGSRFSTENLFGVRILPVSKSNLVDEVAGTRNKISSTTDNVLDFRIPNYKKYKTKVKEKDDRNHTKDMATASAGGGKDKKDGDDEEEKTLAQQVADGKYGLIQNEIFVNGSKRPGILSYASNTEVPKDNRENLGGLEKDEIWLAEDHILVLRGGNYQNLKENKTPPIQVWPPIDNYKAPHRQVKLPKNPDIPPPFPVQLTEDGPIEFIKGQREPSGIPPVIPPLPPFAQGANKSTPFLFPTPNSTPSQSERNKTFPFPIPPHLLPPFLSNLPPGATFVTPPVNQTDIDEDDPSIYYPPRYDFYYSQDNTTAVPPGPLVPGIILPPPPDFFALLENDTDTSFDDHYNETDNNINSVTPNSFLSSKYLPAKKPSRLRVHGHRNLKRPKTDHNSTEINSVPESASKPNKTPVTYVFPENSKQKSPTATTSSQNFFRTSGKTPTNKYPNDFTTPIFVPNNINQSIYHPLPTTSPKPNHITLPTTKTLPKQIYIVTTPETIDKNRIENIYKNSKPINAPKYELINPEIHPLRSLIKPNVTITYNGKYGRLPPATAFPVTKSEEEDFKPIKGFYISPPTKTSKAPSTEINSITVTPIPIIKKIRVYPTPTEKPQAVTSSTNTSKATFYFYEEPSTIESPKLVQNLETPSKPISVHIATNFPPKNEDKTVTNFYYTTKSTSKTPIRQFLEETFHSSNILPQKPQIAHINNAEIITPNSYSEIQKMKHLNYGTHVLPKPSIKYHYETPNKGAIIANPKIKDLEIKNSGSIGLQNVDLDRAVTRPVPKPIVVQDTTEPMQTPETHSPPAPSYVEPLKPTVYKNNDGPFIPSNYYATVRPELIHFTSQEQTLVDDITKNYFTIFGQKINSVSTTPLTPIKSTNEKNKSKQESGLKYISDDGQNFKITQVHENSKRKPAKSSTAFYSTAATKTTAPTQPPSNFEKYLKELTGEDQKDYIVTRVYPTNIKKGKEFFDSGPPLGQIQPHLLSKGPVVIVNGQSPVHQVHSPENSQDQSTDKTRVPSYHPTFSTTLRPVDVEIKPQYIHHISSTSKPLGVYPQIVPQNIRISNFQQYFQEITGLTSPTTTRPVRVKNPNLQYFPTTASPLKPLVFQHPSFQVPEIKPKPVSLEGDILVNFKRPRPVINPEAELINIPAPGLPFDVSSNIKIVDSPNLSKNPNQPYSTKQITFGAAKDIFENLPKPEYFSPSHQTGGNSFVSYNLPGNGGHFYFLTPQLVQKEAETRRRHDQPHKRAHRNEDRSADSPRTPEAGGFSSEIKQNSEEFFNHDYLRRSRKKQ